MRWHHDAPRPDTRGTFCGRGAIMSRIWTTQLLAHIGQRVHLAGWLHHWRRLSRVSFLVLRDGRGLAQVVVEDPALSRRLDGLHRESLLSIDGIVQANPHAPGGVEVHDAAIEVVVPTTSSPPLDLSRPTLRASPSFVLDHAPVALRHPRLRARFEIASASMFGFRTTLRSLDFAEVQTPKIVSAATESGASVFSIDYFGRQAYLAQSPQLYKQIMVGIRRPMDRTTSLRSDIRWPGAPSTRIPTLRVRDTRTASTCCFAGPISSRAA